MPATGWLRRNPVEVLWALFALANLAVILVWPAGVRPSFYAIWISLVLVYGFRLWPVLETAVILVVVSIGMAVVFLVDGFKGDELSGRLIAIPFLAFMFATMVWHSRRRAAMLTESEAIAAAHAALLEQQRRFLDDASHELRTPVTIARGHLELLRREEPDAPELDVALDELARVERVVERLLLLAQAEQPQFLGYVDVEIDRFLEDVFMRWSEVAPRVWRLDLDIAGVISVDAEALRSALDALIENAVKYTDPGAAIELRARAELNGIVIEVADEGCGIPQAALGRIFDRFARADTARTRSQGGTGLGLAIVDAIAKAHGGSCSVEPLEHGTVFALHLPVEPTVELEPGVVGPSVDDAPASGLALSS